GAVALGLEERDRVGDARTEEAGRGGDAEHGRSRAADVDAVVPGLAQRADVERLYVAVAAVPAPAAVSGVPAQHDVAGGVDDGEPVDTAGHVVLRGHAG